MLALRAHVSAVDALAGAARCLPTPWFRASLDSAVRIGAIGSRGLRLLRHDPVVHPLLAGIDTSAGSGLETIAREQLHLTRPGEVVYTYPSKSAAAGTHAAELH